MVYCGRPSTGCQNCRKRHIKCDETVPECKACVRTGRTCPGYKDPFDVMLRDQTAAVHRKHRSQKKQDAKESDNRTKVMSSSSGSSKALISTNGSTVQPSTSEIYFPVSSPFPRSLNQPLEETAISFFFQLISVAQKDPQTLNGFIELLPLVYSNAKSSPHLHLATAAVSLFSVAAWTGDHSLIRLSELCFFRAISRTRVAIGNSAECNSDETLMAVLLLSRYEELTAAKEFKAPEKTHLRGAVALVNNRDPKQLESFLSKSLATSVQWQIVKFSLGLFCPIIKTPKLWPLLSYLPPQTAAARLTVAAFEMVNLRVAWEEALSLPFEKQRILDIMEMAIDVDHQLTAWAFSVPLHWIPVPASSIPQSVRDAGIYRDRCDCYSDMWVASTWNYYRDSRIVVQAILLDCISMLPDEAPPDSAQRALTTIQCLVDDICATVPFYLGSQKEPAHLNMTGIEYPSAAGRPISEAHRRSAPLLGAWFLLPYLDNICCPQLGLCEEQLKWIGEQCQRIRRIYTFGQSCTGDGRR